MDLVLKYLPLIIFIYPLLSWLSGRKRFSHNSKFYSDRALLVKKYEEECLRIGIQDHEKSAFAQALAGTDKLGHRDIDIIKIKFSDKLFIMISKILKIRGKIEIKQIEDNDIFVSLLPMKKLKIRPWLYGFLYVSSIPIFISNNILLWIFLKMGWNVIYVSINTYIFIQLSLLLIGICVAASAALKFMHNEVLVELIVKDKLVISRNEFEQQVNDEN